MGKFRIKKKLVLDTCDKTMVVSYIIEERFLFIFWLSVEDFIYHDMEFPTLIAAKDFIDGLKKSKLELRKSDSVEYID